jgi:Zn2+/Cd2+-exporting ATPase
MTAAERTPATSIWDQHGEAITTVLCGLLVVSGWVAFRLGASPWVYITLYLLGYILGGYRQAIEGLTKLIKERELEVDLLMVVAAAGAAAIGYWLDGALLIFIFALSGTIEGYASARTERDIKALMAINPDEALVVRNGEVQRVAAASLVVGDTVLVKPGERIPADGRVIEGSSAVNQASITGESLPVDKALGDEVFAGTINGHGALRMEVRRPAGDTIIARIIQLVQEAQERRPPAQLFIERFERGYAKVVVAGALLLMVLPTLLLGWTFQQALYRSMIFLVVASPCALAASMMPTLLSALSNGARSGILFKGAAFVESLGHVQVVAFDKTGTLTTGMPSVTDIEPLPGQDPTELLAVAAAVESLSEHPVARAVVAEAHRQNLSLPAATNLQAIPGTGVRAEVGGKEWRVGKAALFPGPVAPEVLQKQQDLEAAGKTAVLVGDDEVRGLIAVQDTLRPQARAAVAELKRLGVQKVVMLTGDSRQTAEAIARQAGVDEVYAELLPTDKVRQVEALVARYTQVAMVGDGVNDAPALAAATVGIAMGAAGTDVALETADIVLMTDDLSKIPYAVRLGRRTLRIIKQNLTVALGVIGVLVVSNLAESITLPLGVVGHEGSTLLVTLNGLRMLRRS